MDEQRLESWLDAYGRAWETRDADAAAKLFTEEGIYAWGPFHEPIRGPEAIHEAWVNATARQDQLRFGYEVLAMTEDGGIARWWASMFALPSRTPTRMEGIFLVSLADDGRCEVFREWWNEDPVATGASEYRSATS
jgi:ketosteroid isomerase-like protein